MPSVCIWNGDSSGWKTRRKDIVSKDQGVTHQSQWQLPRLRGLQCMMERPLDWIRTHSPAFASHTQEGGLCSSKLISASPNVCFPGCWICFPPRKDDSSVLSTPGKASATLLDHKLSRPTGYETQKLHRQIPWKADRACMACPSHPQYT